MKPSMFDGDGRRKVQPVNVPKGTWPIAVTRSTARRLIEMFDKSGFSSHSGRGNLVWVIVTHALEQDITIDVAKSYSAGWFVCVKSLFCGLCKKKLNQPDDPSSLDCGGDCRGCMDLIENDMKDDPE